jgi:hypothetical protein
MVGQIRDVELARSSQRVVVALLGARVLSVALLSPKALQPRVEFLHGLSCPDGTRIVGDADAGAERHLSPPIERGELFRHPSYQVPESVALLGLGLSLSRRHLAVPVIVREASKLPLMFASMFPYSPRFAPL